MNAPRSTHSTAIIFVGLLLALVAIIPIDAYADVKEGQSLHAALRELNQRGAKLVFSNELVVEGMLVEVTPTATDAVEIAREILTAHDLELIAGPEERWLVSRAAKKPPEATAANVNATPNEADEEQLDELSVLANRYVLFGDDSNAELTHDEVDRLPHLADDVMRAVQRLPAVTSDDLSARFNLRGGSRDEAALRLDGLELIDPFHLKDLTGVFSIIDSNLIESVEIMPGGFPAQFGDFASGVVNIESLPPPEQSAHSIGISFINSFVNTSGTFDNQRGGWLISLRRGYLDLLTDDQGSEIFSPRYLDGFAKIEHDIGERHTASLHLLLASEDLNITDLEVNAAGEDIRLAGESDTKLSWARLKSRWSNQLLSENVLWRGDISRIRDINLFDPVETSAIVFDDRSIEVLGFRTDWQWLLSESWVLSFGAEVENHGVDYDYSLSSTTNSILYPGQPTIDRQTMTTVEGENYGIYVAARKKFGQLDAELGLRWDTERYTGLNEEFFSPRLSLKYNLGGETQLTASWGDYNQFQRAEALQVEDGVDSFFPATRTEHRIVGIQHRLTKSLLLRGEAYQKIYRRIRPRFTNLFDINEAIPEANPDRVRIDATSAEASGLELVLKYNPESEISFWTSYAFARAEDRVNGQDVVREWDQRHAVNLVGNWTGDRWNITVATRWHSGWPRTEPFWGIVDTPAGPQPGLIAGDRNGSNYGDYSRVDVRISRDIELRRSEFTYYFEFYNLFDTENTCCVDNISLDSGSMLVLDEEEWGGILPSFGFVWTFH